MCTRAHVHNEIKTFRQVAKRKKYSEEAKQVRCEEWNMIDRQKQQQKWYLSVEAQRT